MMFSGHERTQRRVDLRGRSRNEETRQQTATRLRREKEKRKLRTLQIQSATIIQVAWRNKRTRQSIKDSIRQDWCNAFGVHGERLNEFRELPWNQCVTRVVYFVDGGLLDDIQRLAATCERVLVAVLSQSISQESLENHLVVLLEKCLDLIWNWTQLIVCSEMELASQSTDSVRIVQFILRLLSVKKLKELNLDVVLVPLERRLTRKKILQKLNNSVQLICTQDGGRQSIENSVLEQIILSVLEIEEQCFSDTKLAPFTGAFDLWCIPSLFKFSPVLFQKCCTLLIHILPHSQEANDYENNTPASSKQDINVKTMVCKGHYYAFLNLLKLNTVQFNQAPNLAQLCSVIAQYLDWFISCHRLPPYLEDSDSVSISGTESNPFEDFRSCIEKLMDSQSGQQFLSSLASGLLPEHRLSLFLPNPVLQNGDSAFFRVLNFAFCVSHKDELSELICRLAAHGKVIGFIWFVYIKRIWEETVYPTNQIPSFEVLEAMIPTLTVLVEIYSTALMLVDKTQMEKSNVPLPMKELYDPEEPRLSLIFILKTSFWKFIRKQTTSKLDHSSKQILDGFTSKTGKLLRQLHELCIKWDLAPVEAFHLPDSQVSLIVSEATALASAGKPMEDLPDHLAPILVHAPCLVPFYHRARIFQAQLDFSRSSFRPNMHFIHNIPVFKIRRSHFLEDAFSALGDLKGEDFKRKLRVQFIDKHGLQEAGVDGGGLFKDFMEELSKTTFDPNHGLFAATEQGEIYPNPTASMFQTNALRLLSFLGRIVGKAVYEGILLELPFAHFFLKKFCRQLCDLNDLPSLDQTLYENLKKLKECGETVEELGLTFTITDNVYKTGEELQLKPGGWNIPVTARNVVEYIHRFADYRLNKQGRIECNAFLNGFFDVLDPDWIKIFNPSELQLLISGSTQHIDVEDLKHSVIYGNGFHETHPVIQRLWEVIQSMTGNQQRQFLRFVTGCSIPPLLGFDNLHPKMCIRMSGNEEHPDLDRLPTAATCVNLLKLPPYPTIELLREKLIYAISAESGFDLS
eukprot:g4159.t1